MTKIAAYKFQLADQKNAVLIYYLVLLLIFFFLPFAAVSVGGAHGSANVYGAEATSAIFLFILGLNSFKESFFMLTQNGVSRKRQFVASVLAALTVALAMSVFDKLILLAGKGIAALGGVSTFISVFEMIYKSRAAQTGAFLLQTEMFIFNLFLYFAMIQLGALTTTLFYRLSKAGKIAVGAGVPVFLFVILPALDGILFKYKMTLTIQRFLEMVFGVSTGTPCAAVLTFAVSTAVCCLLRWLLMRRAVIR